MNRARRAPARADSPDSANGRGLRDAYGAGTRSNFAPSRLGGRARPASRADHATRILLGHSQLWEALTGEEHAMLCELPEPHGALFVWLEAQLHEHGPLNWSALRTEMNGHAFEALALRLMAESAPSKVQGEESLLELQGLVLRLAIDRIDAAMKDIAQSAPDADMAQRYRAMQEKRSPLAAQLDALMKMMVEKV